MNVMATSVPYSTWTSYADKPTYKAYAQKTANVAENSRADAYVNSSGETCTDGKDDGKIGFFSAAWNAIKGVGKTIVNGVKGMFTDKNGNFSLGKTLLSIGTVALCIAVPAVGVAACAVGGVMGAVQVGKGIYNVATADTDAEAKEAWQNIGGGAFTVAASVVGAKAGVKAMKTAAGNTAKGSALQSLENAGTKLSAKTLGQYGKAFIQDGYRSGKYNLGQMKTGLATTREALRIKKLENKVNKMEGGLTQKEINIQNELSARKAFATDDTISALDKINHVSDNINNASASAKQAVRHPFSSVNKAIHSDAAATAFKTIKSPIKSLKTIPSNISSGARAVIKAMQSTDSTYAQLVQKYGFESVAEVLELYGGYTIASESV